MYYELDENAGFPQNLKRGVLAEDAVYNILEETKSIGIDIEQE